MKHTIKHGTIEAFFQRGKEVARAADQGDPIPVQQVISAEDPELVAYLESLSPAEITELILSGALENLCPPGEEESRQYTSFPPASERQVFDAKACFGSKDAQAD